MINPPGDKEEYDYWGGDLPLVNYLEEDRYEWLFNSLDE